MGIAMLDGQPMRIDPESVTWDYKIKAQIVKTIGGKVVQIYGADLGDMVVVGSFGKGGWVEQEAFLKRIKAIAEAQNQSRTPTGKRKGDGTPVRFTYPPRGWDFLVYVKDYKEPGGGRSVRLANENINPRWQLTLFLVHDNVGLKQVAQDLFINRLADGIGFERAYHGPPTMAEADAATASPAPYAAPTGDSVPTMPG